MDNADYSSMNSQRTGADDQQQQDGRRNRASAGSNGKVDFRFLIPSRDAGGRLTQHLFSLFNVKASFSFRQLSLAKVGKTFRISV